MRGRKAELKAVDGGLAGVPKAPESVPSAFRGEWDAIGADMLTRRILTPPALGLLETYLIARWTVREAQKAIQTHGALVEGAHKALKPNPGAIIPNQAIAPASPRMQAPANSQPKVTLNIANHGSPVEQDSVKQSQDSLATRFRANGARTVATNSTLREGARPIGSVRMSAPRRLLSGRTSSARRKVIGYGRRPSASSGRPRRDRGPVHGARRRSIRSGRAASRKLAPSPAAAS